MLQTAVKGPGNTRWKGRCRGSTFLVEGLYCHHPSSLIVPVRVEGLELLSFFLSLPSLISQEKKPENCTVNTATHGCSRAAAAAAALMLSSTTFINLTLEESGPRRVYSCSWLIWRSRHIYTRRSTLPYPIGFDLPFSPVR